MKRLTRTLPIFLAAALQIMPLVRNLFINPAAGNTIAFILKWGIGTGVVLGGVDAVSGATAATFTSTNHYYMTALSPFPTDNITNNLVGWLGSSGQADSTVDTFSLSAYGTTVSPITNKQIVTATMPTGLNFRAFWTNNSQYVFGQIYGTPTVAGTFTNLVKFSSPGNGSISITITFTINNAPAPSPVITNQPVSLTNNVGNNAAFSVTAGPAPLSYQWYFNTNTALLNATNTSLSLTNIQLTNTGSYSVIITNSSGSVTSSFATLTVWQPPVITNQPVSVTTLAGSSPAFSVTAGGVPPVAYQWNFNTNTALTGATANSLSLPNVRASQSGTYSVVITNSAGSITSSIASLTVTNPLPTDFAPAAPAMGAGNFQFTFTPVIGLTNTVLTNGLLAGGVWNVFTNIPPPATATPIVISNFTGSGNLFYRVMVMP
jgi:hypothetical protein